MTNPQKIILFVFLVAAVVGGIFLWRPGDRPAHQNQKAPSAANKIFDLALHNYNGENVKLADFRGKPLIINSWAAWCPFCKKELVDFAAAQKEFGDQAIIIAIDRAEPLETAKKFSDEAGITDQLIFLLDPADVFYQSIGGFSMPETIFINKNGAIQIHKRGPMELAEIRDKINKLISF